MGNNSEVAVSSDIQKYCPDQLYSYNNTSNYCRSYFGAIVPRIVCPLIELHVDLKFCALYNVTRNAP